MFSLIPKKNPADLVRDSYLPRIFDSFFNDMLSFGQLANTSFKIDVKETADAYELEADLPGIAKEDISLEYANEYLTITAKRENKLTNTDSEYLRQERYFGVFQRSFFLDNLNADQINAAYTNGVLKVILPKKDRSISAKHKIKIK